MDNKSDEFTRRLKQKNTRYRKIQKKPMDDTANVTSQEKKREQPKEMTEQKAREILGVNGYPFHGIIGQKAASLLKKHAPEHGGHPRKYKEIWAAEAKLKRVHDGIIREFRTYLDREIYPVFEKSVEQLQQSNKRYDFSKVVPKLKNLNEKFFENLKHTASADQLETQYRKEFQEILDSYTEIPHAVQRAISEASKPLKIDLDKAQDHLPYGYQEEMEDIAQEDAIELFHNKYHDYLNDLLLLKHHYKHHQEVFDALYDGLKLLGDNFYKKIQQENVDIELVSKKYAEFFKLTVADAKEAFAQEPGIWQNLSPILQNIFTVIFVIKFIIAFVETPEDRYRMFNPDQHGTIIQRWEQWEMDCMPELDIKTTTPTKFQE